jgi:hypothetical protein
MPGPTVKEILLKWGIDNSNWKKAIGELAQLLEKTNKDSAKAQSQAASRLEAQKAKLKEVVAARKSETEEINKQIGQLKVQAATAGAVKAEAVSKLAAEKAASAEAGKQAALQKTLQTIQKTLQQEVYTKLMNEKLVTAEINRQNAALRLQTAQQRAASGAGGRGGAGGGGGGAGGGFLGGLFGGLGSKFGGTLTTGVAAGELLAHTIEGLIQKITTFIKDSGPLEQVRQQFEKLAQIKGLDSVKFIDDLRKATHNLVNDIDLYRIANKFMQSGIKASEPDIIKLTQATVGLARAQGRDATQALNALSMGLATGRFQRLAYITGLTREELTVRGLSATMSAAQRNQAQFDRALSQITKRYQEFGEPALTVTDLLRQMDVISNRLFEAFGRGIVQSRGMAVAFQFLQEIMTELNSGEGGVATLGQKFGDALIVFVEVAKALGSIATTSADLWKKLVETFAPKTISDDFISRLTTLTGLLKTAAGAAVLVKGTFREMALRAEYTGKEAKVVGQQDYKRLGSLVGIPGPAGGYHGVADLHTEFDAKLEKINEEQDKELAALEALFKASQKPTESGATGIGKPGAQTPEEVIALERQQRQLALKGKEADAKIELALEKGKLEQLKQANEEFYDAGLESLQDYIQKKKDLQQRELQDTLKEIADEAKAKQQALTLQSQEEFMDPKSLAMSRANIAKEAQQKEIDARNATQRALSALDMKGITDQLAARKKLADTIDALEKAQIERSRQNTEEEFKQGEIGAQEYLDKRIQYIEEDYEATKTAEQKKLEENKNSETAKEEFAQKMAKAAEDREKALTTLALNEIDIRTKATEQSYDRAQKLIEGQLQYQQSLNKTTDFGGGRQEEQALIQEQIELLRSRLEEEAKSLKLTQEGSEAWFQQLEKIQSTKEALVKYNEELAKSQEWASGVASALKEMSQAAATFPKIGAQRVSKGLDTLAKGLEEQEQARQRIAQRKAAQTARAQGQTVAPVTPDQIFKSLQKASQDAGDSLGKHLEAASTSVDDWRVKLIQATQALTDFIDRATGGKSSGNAKGGGTGSGPATAANPLGTTTSSDMMMLTPAEVTSAKSPAEAGLALSAALSSTTVAASSLQKGFTSLLTDSLGNNGLLGFFKNLGKNTQAASDDLSNFADSISSIGSEVGGLVSAAKGTGGAFEAGMQGMQAGGGLGGSIGGMFGPMGAMIGQGVGMAVGGVIGIFSGKAKTEAEKLAKQITAQFNAVLVEVQAGTLGLGNAVTQEIQIIQEAVDQLSGKKGGRSELQQMLPQMEQQLEALQQQQQQVIKSFDTTMEQISAPEASQALVQPIQAIIQSYQQYILAGGNVATANQFLQASFQNLVTQGLNTLNNAEQSAVNNALNYNNLLLQRQQLIQSTNQQIQDVMSQGVAVQQMPEGVQKAQELEQIQINSQNQMDQLDQQIAVSNHQLQNEQKIFQLATTRVGLETQLVQLQDAQLDQQDASTAALMQEVAAFSGATPTNLPTALNMIGLGGQYINPSTEPGLMPTPPVPTGIAAIDEQNELQYQQALAYYNQQANLSGSATIGSTTGNIIGGAQGVTPAGSSDTALTASFQTLGSNLDALASNLTAFPAALQTALTTMFTSPTTILNVGGALLTSIASALGAAVTTTSGAAAASIGQSSSTLVASTATRQAIEQNISTLSSTRVQNETQLVNLKMQEIAADMERIKAWSTLLNSPTVTGTNSQTLEDMMNSLYQTRSRQGFGGFQGEINNPTPI